MFDPHGTRRRKRNVTRKGQIIQAKAVDPPVTIDPRLVPIYRNYLTANHITAYIPPNSEPDWATQCPLQGYLDPATLRFYAPFIEADSENLDYNTTKTFVLYDEDDQSKARIYCFTNRENLAWVTISGIDAYASTSEQDLQINNFSIPIDIPPTPVGSINLYEEKDKYPYILVDVDLVLSSLPQ